jgi:hypothetical protein
VTLTPEEWRVFFLVNGHRSLREICQLAGNPDELGTLEILNRLLSGNLIGFASSRASPQDAADEEALETIKQRVGEPTARAVQAGTPTRIRRSDGARVVVSSQAVPYTSQTVVTWARLILQGDEPATAMVFPLTRETQTSAAAPKKTS